MVFLGSFSSYLPARIVTNEELAPRLGVAPEWIAAASGVRERRFAADNESVSDLAFGAARQCLDRAGQVASGLGMVLVASGSAERAFPGPAVDLSRRLGMEGKPAIDLPLPSTGALFALALAARLAPAEGPILVVAAECMSRIVMRDPLDRNTAILFGDGAGACLVSPEAGRAEIRDFVLCSDGTYSEDLKLEHGRPLEMNGPVVMLQASRKLPRAIGDLLERNRLAPAGVESFLLHQANQNLLDRVPRSLSVPAERIFTNIARYGNTSSASMLIAAAEWEETHGFRPQAPVVLAAFGAGFNWGALLAIGR